MAQLYFRFRTGRRGHSRKAARSWLDFYERYIPCQKGFLPCFALTCVPLLSCLRRLANRDVRNVLEKGRPKCMAGHENILPEGAGALDGSGALRYRPRIKFRTPQPAAGEVRWTQNQ